MLAAIVNVSKLVEEFGYPLLFLVVMAESGGIPVPGETGLITAAVLASTGKLEIEIVIALAALAAIVGDNIGYLIGRRGGRWLLERPGRFHAQRQQVLDVGEPFFERHGPKAVFFGRFVLGLRVWASWLAGATRMPWRSFALWNALGGICWATGIGLLAYFLGHAAGNAVSTFGLYGVIALVLAIASFYVAHRRQQRRVAAGLAQPRSRAQPGSGEQPVSGALGADVDADGRADTSADPDPNAHPDAASDTGAEQVDREALSGDDASERAPDAPRGSG